MSFSRREILAGLAALSACAPAGRTGGDVFAAGQPAAILVFALAPGRLLGWPRRPESRALALLPPSADLPQLGALTSGGAPVNLEAVAALRPELIIDYGDRDPSYQAIAARVRERIGAPYRLLDGALTNTPSAVRQAGSLLGVPSRGARLSKAAEDILARWSSRRGAGPNFYYARGRDGLETGFTGSLATEVLEGAGWTNVAVGGRDIGRVAREQVAAWDAEVLVTLDAGFAQAAARDPFWRQRRQGGMRRLLLLPDAPFGWIDRPPSINRLLGCAWLADAVEAATDPASVQRITADFMALFYGARPGAAALQALIPRWLA